MKIQFSMRTPDTVDSVVKENASNMALQAINDGVSREFDELVDEADFQLRQALECYISNGENIQLCIDTETWNMTVVPRI